jgi:flavin-dependent dehydrogenase
VYRVYFENLTGELLDPPYLISFFHMGKPGIDWVITDKDSVDILVGKFGTAGELTQEEIDEAVADYRSKYPFVGQKVVRGGSVEKIPLSKMLPLLVADGYALVGDSAGMTIPLNGSGIVLSMNAGKILADKIIVGGSDTFSKKNLWNYQYEYFQTFGKDLVMIDILKNFFTHCKAKDIDYFLEKKILTEEMLDFGGGINITPQFILHIATVGLPLVGLLPALVNNLKSIPSIDSVAAQMPEKYSKEAVEEWVEKYSRL